MIAALLRRRPSTVYRSSSSFKRKKKTRSSAGKAFLAEPAKWRRVLEACDYWFGSHNLHKDEFMLLEMSRHDGWMPIRTLATFGKLRDWCEEETVLGALSNPSAHRYRVTEDGLFVRRSAFGSLYDKERVLLGEDWRQAPTETLRGVFDYLPLERPALVEAIERKLPGVDVLAYIAVKRAAPAKKDDAPLLKPKRPSLPVFATSAEVVVVANDEDLGPAIERLRGTAQDSYYGFDVEFCRMGDDDLTALPAMVQLSTRSMVVLVWLDKLREHGRLALRGELGAFLAEEDKSLVGVGAAEDARSLEEFSLCTVRGVVDLNDLSNGSGTLAKLTSLHLGRRLEKRKSSKSAAKAAHWRAPALTKAMRQYAANDANAAYMVARAILLHQHDGHGGGLFR